MDKVLSVNVSSHQISSKLVKLHTNKRDIVVKVSSIQAMSRVDKEVRIIIDGAAVIPDLFFERPEDAEYFYNEVIKFMDAGNEDGKSNLFA